MTSQQVTKTLGNLSSLPLLPVPELEKTCDKYLESVKPFISEQEFQETKEVVYKFKNGVGKSLHKKLLARSKKTKNWLEDWWLDTYLMYRGRLPFFSSIGGFGVQSDDELHRRGVQVKYAAETIYGYLKVYQEFARQEYPVHKLHKKYPMDMSQMYNCFSSGRYPGVHRDTQVLHFYKDGELHMKKHIIVVVQGRIFELEALDDSYEPLRINEIESLLYKLKAIAVQKPTVPWVGSLTTLPRAEWKRLQDHLFELDKNNSRIVDSINQSILMFVLDDQAPLTREETMLAFLGADCRSRWFDKGLILNILDNGIAGSTADHVHFEGIAVSMISSRSREFVAKYYAKDKNFGQLRQLKEPMEHEFVTDDVITQAIHKAEIEHRQVVSTLQIADRCFKAFGRNVPKEQRINPESFIQVALHLAYYRLHQCVASAYQTTTTRKFYSARTETLRTCTMQSTNFVRVADNPNVLLSRKSALLREALETHDELGKEATDGQGIDRHLFGLQMIAAEEGIETPSIFKDKAWKLSGGGGNFTLSTSCAGLGIDHGGMGPMIEDGYGVFYALGENSLEITVSCLTTSPKTNSVALMDELFRALHDVKNLLATQSHL